MFCPKCKSEFREGFTRCSKCKIDLVVKIEEKMQDNDPFNIEEDLVTITSFSQVIDAYLVRSKLESEGIACVIQNENILSLNWLLSNAIGGVQLLVQKSDIIRAQELLRDVEDTVSQENASGDESVFCPACHASNVYFEKVNRRLGYASLLFSFPILFPKNKMVCKACGHEWKTKKSS